jgi:ATP-binding cassette subfamily B protein
VAGTINSPSKTWLIVTHRFSFVDKLDKIIVVENGNITAFGTHEQLLKSSKYY